MMHSIRRWAATITVSPILLAFGCDPFHAEFDNVEPAQMYERTTRVKTKAAKDALSVMSYNVKFGGGRIDFFFDCHGDRVSMKRSEVFENLERLAAVINAVAPDILLLEEVDVNSKRAAYIDQLQWLLDHTNLNYAAYASQWRADFVPSDGVGPVDSGTAIASRFPISDATRYALPSREDQNALVSYFYLHRNVLEATVDVGEHDVRVIAVHTEAYSSDGTKKKHIETFERHVDEAAKSGIVLAGGDLNTLPPDSKQKKDFADSACDEEYLADDFSEESAWLQGLYDKYESAIPLVDYQANNAPYFSHSTSQNVFWNRTLDYLFSNQRLRNGAVLQGEVGGFQTMDVSDHAPLVVEMELPR